MTSPEERDSLERLLGAWRPAPVSGLGERSLAAVSDRAFGRRIAWFEAGGAARWVLCLAVPLLIVATTLALVSVSRARSTPEPSRPGRLFQPSLRVAGLLGEELE
jgi:hypothetical protein